MTAWKKEKTQKQHVSALPVEKDFALNMRKNWNSLYQLGSHPMLNAFQTACQGYYAITVLDRP